MKDPIEVMIPGSGVHELPGDIDPETVAEYVKTVTELIVEPQTPKPNGKNHDAVLVPADPRQAGFRLLAGEVGEA